MTVVLKNAFPNRVDISDPNYPWGKGINQQEGVVDSGTPIDATWFNDVEGGKQGLLRLAGIVPSGVPDNVSDSDVTKAIKIISKFQSAGNVVGSFRYGCTVTSSEEITIDNNGAGWKYVGGETLPYTVPQGTDPSAGDWELVKLNSAKNQINENGGSVQDYINKNQTPFASVSDISIGSDISGANPSLSLLSNGTKIRTLNFYSDKEGGGAEYARDSFYDDPLKAGNSPEVIGQEFIVYTNTGAAFKLVNMQGMQKKCINAAQVGVIADAGSYNPADSLWYVDSGFTTLATDNYESVSIIKALTDDGDCYVDFGAGRIAMSQQVILAGSRNTYRGAGKEVCKFVSQGNSKWNGGDSIIELGVKNDTNNVSLVGIFFDATTTNDLSGMTMNMFYNTDFNSCQFKSGDYVASECAGLTVKSAKHTKMTLCNLNNSLCYSLMFQNTGGTASQSEFTLVNCAFDESQSSIVVHKFVEELKTLGCHFGGLGNQYLNGDAPYRGYHIFADAVLFKLETPFTTFEGGGVTPYGVKVQGDGSQITDLTGATFKQFTRFAVVDNGNASTGLIINGAKFISNGTAGTSTDINDSTDDYQTTPFCTDVYILRANGGNNIISGCQSNITNRYNVVAQPDATSISSGNFNYLQNQGLKGGAAVGPHRLTGRLGLEQSKQTKSNILIATGFEGFSTTTVLANSTTELPFTVTGASLTHRVEWSYAVDWDINLIATVRVSASGQLSLVISNLSGGDLSWPGGNLFYDVFERSNQ